MTISALDLTTLTLLFNQEIVATGIVNKKVDIIKWLPFIKKNVKCIEFTYLGQN